MFRGTALRPAQHSGMPGGLGAGFRHGFTFLMLLALWSRAAQGQPATVRGSVVDSAGRPIAGALLSVDGTPGLVSTDAQGLFLLANLPPGARVVRVRAVGWKPVAFEIDLEPGAERTGKIALEHAVVQLPDLRTAGDSSEVTPAGRRMAGFEFRRRHNAGTFRDRAAIERMNALVAGDLLRNIPGVRVISGSTDSHVKFMRCSERVSAWIDGDRVRTAGPDEALGLIHPNDIEAIEIYRGLSQIPAEFLDDSCAAIVISTRARD